MVEEGRRAQSGEKVLVDGRFLPGHIRTCPPFCSKSLRMLTR